MNETSWHVKSIQSQSILPTFHMQVWKLAQLSVQVSASHFTNQLDLCVSFTDSCVRDISYKTACSLPERVATCTQSLNSECLFFFLQISNYIKTDTIQFQGKQAVWIMPAWSTVHPTHNSRHPFLVPVPVHARQHISGSKLPMDGSDLPCNPRAVAAAFFLPPSAAPDLSMHATHISNSNQVVFTFKPCSSIGGTHAALPGRQENFQTFCTHRIVNAGCFPLRWKWNRIDRACSKFKNHCASGSTICMTEQLICQETGVQSTLTCWDGAGDSFPREDKMACKWRY